MTIGPGIRRLLRLPLGRRIEREIDDELRFHIEMRVEALTAAGVLPDEARRRAQAEFGDVGGARRELARIDRSGAGRKRWRARREQLIMDARYSLRGMRRSPAFALTVVATLAVGIGVNAAMFSVVDRLLLRPAPHVAHPESLRSLYYRVTFPVMGTFTSASRGYSDYTDLVEQGTSFAGVAAWYAPVPLTVGVAPNASRARGLLATASFFPVLGVRPLVGRFFAADEDFPARGAPVAVLSYGYWQRTAAGDRTVVGQRVTIEGTPFTIIGVAPEGFRGLGVEPVDLFVPMSTLAARFTSPDWATTRGWQWLNIVARRKGGVTDAAAAAQATAIFRRGHEKNQAESTGTAIMASVIPGQAPTGDTLKPLTLLLLTVSVLVLVIATANVSNLLLTRALRRRREIAVRVALGVSKARLYSQLLSESVVLAMASIGGAMALAWVGGTLLRKLLLPTFAPDDPVVDHRVFGVAALVGLVVGLLGGLAPALTVNRRGFMDVVRAGMLESGHRRSGLRTGLVITQAAFTVVLVVGAGLFLASLRNVVTQDLGFDPDHVLVASLLLNQSPDSVRSAALAREGRDRIAALPGVEHASVTVSIPFMWSWGTKLRVEGIDSLPRLPDGGPYVNSVDDDFLATMGMHLLRGRAFQPGDVKGSPPVAIINQTMARVYFGNREALGRCLYLGDPPSPCTTIVGIVADARRQSVRAVESAQYMVLDRQETWKAPAHAIVARTAGDPHVVANTVQRALESLGLHPEQMNVSFLRDQIEPGWRPWRLGASLLASFGLVALVVAAVGLYGVVSFDTAQRTQEVGVRMALGARARSIFGLVVADGLRSAVIGTVVGLAIVLGTGPFVANFLFEISPRDPRVLGASAGILLGVAALACLVPARRATRIAPTDALRCD